MIVDFHTHIFPDSIAEKTISKLSSMIGVTPNTDATLEGLKASMKEAGIDWSVVLPVVTRPGQFETVNDYAASINGKDGIISFGGLHPNTENYKGEIDRIVELGLPGIKLHPDFQATFIDEQSYINIITYALQNDLMVTIHAGVDGGLETPVHCTPKRTLKMLRAIQKNQVSTENIILAHTGGLLLWDDVEKYLVGENVFFDTSFTRFNIREEQMLRIINKHGAERILLGSDSPWDGQSESVEFIQELPISVEEKEKILGKNAEKKFFKKDLHFVLV